MPEKITNIKAYVSSLKGGGLNTEKPIEEQPVGLQSILATVHNLAAVVCPSVGGMATLRTPSIRLLELGLLSEGAQNRIALMNEPPTFNTITIKRPNETTFVITEAYKESEDTYVRRDNGESIRKDSYTEEIWELKFNDNQFALNAWSRELPKQLFNGKGSYVLKKTGEPERLEPMAITPRKVNTTLALMLEGIKPGLAAKFFTIASPKTLA